MFGLVFCCRYCLFKCPLTWVVGGCHHINKQSDGTTLGARAYRGSYTVVCLLVCYLSLWLHDWHCNCRMDSEVAILLVPVTMQHLHCNCGSWPQQMIFWTYVRRQSIWITSLITIKIGHCIWEREPISRWSNRQRTAYF